MQCLVFSKWVFTTVPLYWYWLILELEIMRLANISITDISKTFISDITNHLSFNGKPSCKSPFITLCGQCEYTTCSVINTEQVPHEFTYSRCWLCLCVYTLISLKSSFLICWNHKFNWYRSVTGQYCEKTEFLLYSPPWCLVRCLLS